MAPNDTLAYAAGVLDGDGYFSVIKGRNPRYDHPYYQAKIGVKQLWPGQALRFLARTLGGKVVREPQRPGLRPIGRWERYDRGAKLAIKQLLPYLQVKREQAVLLLELQELKGNRRGEPELRFSSMERIRQRVLSLNRGRIKRQADPSRRKNRNWVAEVNEVEVLAYLAGVMDSDGSFKIEKRRAKGMINPFYRIKVGAGQVAPSPAIELLAETFGGTIRVRGDGRKGHRPLARWSLFDRSAVPALEALLAYVVIKAPQARLLLQLRELKAKGKLGTTEWVHPTRWHRPIKMRKRCYSKAQVRAFDRLYRTVKALHGDSPPLSLPPPPDERRPRLTGSSPRCR